MQPPKEYKFLQEQVFDGKELQKATILGGRELIKETILVSQSNNEVQVMNEKTYKTIDIRKPKKISFDTKMVKVIKLDYEYFLVPINFS